MKIVYLEWEDANTTLGWHDPDKNETAMIRSCGLLVNKTKKAVTISTCQSRHGRHLDQLNVPASQIRKFKVLKKLPR